MERERHIHFQPPMMLDRDCIECREMAAIARETLVSLLSWTEASPDGPAAIHERLVAWARTMYGVLDLDGMPSFSDALWLLDVLLGPAISLAIPDSP